MSRAVKYTVAIFYGCCLCYLVFFARRREAMQHRPAFELVNLVPVKNQIEAYRILRPNDRKGRRNFYANLIGNVLLFLPMPACLSVFGLRKKGELFLAALSISIAIEVVQYLLTIGVADVDDVLLNAAGAALGILLLNRLPASLNPETNHFLKERSHAQ